MQLFQRYFIPLFMVRSLNQEPPLTVCGSQGRRVLDGLECVWFREQDFRLKTVLGGLFSLLDRRLSVRFSKTPSLGGMPVCVEISFVKRHSTDFLV